LADPVANQWMRSARHQVSHACSGLQVGESCCELLEALRRLSFSRLNLENKRIVKELYVKIKDQSTNREEQYAKVV
jgi:hypothetical protein